MDVVTVERGTYRPVLTVLGTVEPRQELVLNPEVGGRVIELSDAFEPGTVVDAGEILLQIDPADYELRLAHLRTDLQAANAELKLEMGQQEVARQEFSMVQQDIAPEAVALVLREPQLESAKARVAAAEVAIAQAQLDLERTQVRTPFAALVLERSVSAGSQVSEGQELGRLVGLDHYWVTASLRMDQLPYVEIPQRAGEAGSAARIRSRSSWPEQQYREGRLVGLIGELDRSSRLAKVNIEVSDPLGLNSEAKDKPALMLGSIVEVSIEGRALEHVVRLDRELLRADDTVWVMEAGELRIVPVTIVFRDATHVFIREGLGSAAKVVVPRSVQLWTVCRFARKLRCWRTVPHERCWHSAGSWVRT